MATITINRITRTTRDGDMIIDPTRDGDMIIDPARENAADIPALTVTEGDEDVI